MILVFDTNVFLKRHRHLWELLEYFPSLQSSPQFFIAIDEEQALIREYLDYSKNADPEDPIRVIVERILDGTSLFVLQRTAKQMKRTLHTRLNENDCVNPIEPELFAVTDYFKDAILIYPTDIESLPIQRRYLESGVLSSIQVGNVGPHTASVGEVLKLLREPREYSPDNLNELYELLFKYRVEGKDSEEREFLEFKCPDCDFLSQKLLRKTVAAICGLLNTREGWVFIGVEDGTGSIKPFPPKYNESRKQASVDQLLRDIYAEVNRISPRPGKLVKIWSILDAQRQNCVVVIRVCQGSQSYKYRDENGLGTNLGTTRYIREWAQTVEDLTSDGKAIC